MALYKRMILPSLALSLVIVFGTPSTFASRTLFVGVAICGGTFSALTPTTENVLVVVVAAGNGFCGGETAVVCDAEVVAVVVFAPATSFFHFFTVSFARSATLLSSCVRSFPTTIPNLVD